MSLLAELEQLAAGVKRGELPQQREPPAVR
jgi:hypothetical protein